MSAVVVVVVVSGGEQLLYMGPPGAHVWSKRIQNQNPLFLLLFYFKSPCMVQLPIYAGLKKKRERRGGFLF